jgi:hypothetical protein
MYSSAYMGMSHLALVEPKFTPCTRFCPPDRAEDVQTHFDFWRRHSDQVNSTARAKHRESLLGHLLQSHEVEDVVGSSRQQIAYCLDGLRLLGVDYVSRPESFGCLEPFRMDVDHDDPQRAGDARATHGIEPNASGAEDYYAVAGGNTCGIQDSAGARYNAAAEQCRLSEWELLRHDRELIFMDQRPFGKAAQSETLKQANPLAAQARGIRGPAERRLGTSALEGAAR